MARLELRLLGSFSVALDHVALTGFRSDKVRALLAYLVLAGEGGAVRREVLASMLWEGYTPETARHSLRTALHNLRHLLAPLDLLETSRQAVRFDTSHPAFWCDALALQALLRTIAALPEHELLARRQEWLASLDRYRDPLLNGLNLLDSPAFEAWKTGKRAWYAEQIALARRRLAQLTAQQLVGLPRRTTPFFGREEELAALRGKLLDPDYPLLTLVGEGGIGKTRLALEAARQVSDYFADGVWFVPLLDLALPAAAAAGPATAPGADDRLAIAIGQAIQLSFTGRSRPVAQLLDHLRDKQMLLVLDNFEHLLVAASFVADLVHAAPGVTVLVTSRQRLDLQMEWTYRLHGLPVPDLLVAPGRQALGFSSLQLFAERAARRSAGFTLNAENAACVIDICQAVEGLPLAIELAAALTDERPCQEIARAVRRNLNLLATAMRDLPPRHRSLRAVFEHSWQLLPPAEAQLLARCSVFGNGFQAEAAAAILAATPQLLTALVDKSLLRQEEGDRYGLHASIRQLAAEHWETREPNDRRQVLARHSAYYLTWVGDLEAAIFRSDREALRRLRVEFANIRQAWEQVLATGALALIDHSMVAIYEYCHLEGLTEEALSWFAAAIDKVRRLQRTAPADLAPSPDQVLSSLLALHASFLQRHGQTQAANAAIQEALRLARTPKAKTLALLNRAEMSAARGESGSEASTLLAEALCQVRAWRNPVIEAMTLHRMAGIYYLDEDHDASRQAALQALQAYADLGDATGRAAMLVNLGLLGLDALVDLNEAQGYFEQALQLQETAGNRQIEAISLLNLALIALIKGDYPRALEQAAAAQALASALRHKRFQIIALETMGQAHAALGDFDRAQALYEQALAQARPASLTLQVGDCLRGLADLALSVGDYEAARQRTQELHSVAAALSSTHKGHAWRLQGHCHLARQELPAAAAAYQQAVAIQAASSRPYGQMESLAGLATIALAQGQPAAALDYVERLFAWWQPDPLAANPQVERIFLAVYRTLQANDDPRAAEILRQAQAFLLARAARLPDSAARERYLTATDERRAIMRLAQA